MSIEFKSQIRLIAIKIKGVLVEAYNSVSLVKRYYAPLRCLYEIIQDKLKDKHINNKIVLQIAVKAVNNLTGLNSIVPTLLVFSAYLQLTKIDPLSLSITKRVEAIYVVTKEVCCLYIKRQVKDVLAIRNSLNTKVTLDLLLQLDVRVQRKKKGQKGLYKLIIIDREICIINIL